MEKGLCPTLPGGSRSSPVCGSLTEASPSGISAGCASVRGNRGKSGFDYGLRKGCDTAQVGPQISEHLDIPVISYAEDIKIDGDSVVVQRQYEDRYHILKAKMPCLVTALAELNEPRYMTPGGIFDAYDAEVTVWGRKDLKDVDDSNLGLAGSPTKIAKASDKVRKGAGEKVTLDPEEAVDYIMDKLAEKHVI